MEKTIVFGLMGIISCICIFLAWFFTHKAKHEERLLMIEKGLNPNEDSDRGGRVRLVMAKLGIVIVGVGIGLAIIGILVEFHALGRSGAVPMGILGICGGAGLVVANRTSSTKK